MNTFMKIVISGLLLMFSLGCDTSTEPNENSDPQEPNYNEYWVGEYSGTFQLTEHEYGEPSSYTGECDLIIANNGTNRLSVSFRPDDFPNVLVRGDVSSTGAFLAEYNDGDQVAALNRSGSNISGTIFDVDRDVYDNIIITRNFSISVTE